MSYKGQKIIESRRKEETKWNKVQKKNSFHVMDNKHSKKGCQVHMFCLK